MDLGLRFGCGAISGLAVLFGFWMAADVFGENGMAALTIGLPLACGLLAMLFGDSFFHWLMKVLKWL